MATRDNQRIGELKQDANVAKERLMDILNELYLAGGLREARGLASVIEKLEAWQNRETPQ